MTYPIYRYAAILMLTIFLLLLPWLTKPNRNSNHSANSVAWLRIQMMAAGLCAVVFGLLTVLVFWTNLTRKEATDWHIALVESTPVGIAFSIVFVIFDVTVPFLFALSIRWIRTSALRRSITGHLINERD